MANDKDKGNGNPHDEEEEEVTAGGGAQDDEDEEEKKDNKDKDEKDKDNDDGNDDKNDDENAKRHCECEHSAPEAAYFYATGSQRVRPGEAFTFNRRHEPGELSDAFGFDGARAIELRKKGTYLAHYTLLPHDADITAALTLDNAEVAGSRYTDRSRLAPLYGQALICVECDVPVPLRLVNASHRRTAHVERGPLARTVSVSLTIIKL